MELFAAFSRSCDQPLNRCACWRREGSNNVSQVLVTLLFGKAPSPQYANGLIGTHGALRSRVARSGVLGGHIWIGNCRDRLWRMPSFNIGLWFRIHYVPSTNETRRNLIHEWCINGITKWAQMRPLRVRIKLSAVRSNYDGYVRSYVEIPQI